MYSHLVCLIISQKKLFNNIKNNIKCYCILIHENGWKIKDDYHGDVSGVVVSIFGVTSEYEIEVEFCKYEVELCSRIQINNSNWRKDMLMCNTHRCKSTCMLLTITICDMDWIKPIKDEEGKLLVQKKDIKYK